MAANTSIVDFSTFAVTIPKPVTPQPAVETPSIFALLIGIDKYAAVPGLKGAVADAQSIRRYLRHVGVPADQIRYLVDADATRGAIIRALKDFQYDRRIRRDQDCIFIFYAGHGGEKGAPPGWEARGSKVQTILPVDFQTVVGDRLVQSIPDRTIARLLDDIAEDKGNNIVVIFDCCHSGGANRVGDEDTPTARSVEMLHDIPADLDENIWASPAYGRGIEYEAGFLHRGRRSHVFLAACSADEKAFEASKNIGGELVRRGEFTYALISVIRQGADQMTYTEILSQIAAQSLPSQNPQCEGLHRDRILFRAHVPSRYLDLRRLLRSGDKYIMDAGTAYGITEGAEFKLYRDQQSALENTSLGTLFVTKCNTFDSELSIPSSPELMALQTRAGIRPTLLLRVPHDDSRLDLVFKAVAIMECSHTGPRQISLVDKGETGAMLDIASESDGRLVFNILDESITQYGLTSIPYRVENKLEDITSVLKAAAHYYWHLSRTTTLDDHRLRRNIDIEFTALEDVPDEFDEDFQMLRRVRGGNLIQDGIIHVVADTQEFYGMKITNRSLSPIYVSVFYFNNSDLSIASYYQPGIAGRFKPDSCVKENGGSLTIGYGAGGTPSFRYTMKDLPEDQTVDVGLIKAFITTNPVDFSNVPRDSAFANKPGFRKNDLVGRNSVKTWDTITIPIIQRRMT